MWNEDNGFEMVLMIERKTVSQASQAQSIDPVSRMRIDDVSEGRSVTKMQLYQKQVSLGEVPMLQLDAIPYSGQLQGMVGKPASTQTMRWRRQRSDYPVTVRNVGLIPYSSITSPYLTQAERNRVVAQYQNYGQMMNQSSDTNAQVLGLSARLREHRAAEILKRAIKNYGKVNMREKAKTVAGGFISRRIKQQIEKKKGKSATGIQTAFRGYLARAEGRRARAAAQAAARAQAEDLGARGIQALFRERRARKELAAQEAANRQAAAAARAQLNRPALLNDVEFHEGDF